MDTRLTCTIYFLPGKFHIPEELLLWSE